MGADKVDQQTTSDIRELLENVGCLSELLKSPSLWGLRGKKNSPLLENQCVAANFGDDFVNLPPEEGTKAETTCPLL